MSSRGRAEDAVSALLQVSRRRPTVVVVEDVHWADDATLDALRYLCRRISAVPRVLLLTFRETSIGAEHPLRQVLAALSGSTVRRLDLPPLSVERGAQAGRRARRGGGRDPPASPRATRSS